MERFTFRTVGGTAVLYLGDSSEWAIISGGNNHEYKISGDAVDRLAAYEDTGLEPEEVADAVTAAKLMARSKIVSCFGVDADHIRELVKAEKDGRLVVLPCKVGDTIWRIKCFADWPDIGKPYVEADAFLYRDIHYFGKTVFLTREEAEAALAQKGGTHEDSGSL